MPQSAQQHCFYVVVFVRMYSFTSDRGDRPQMTEEKIFRPFSERRRRRTNDGQHHSTRIRETDGGGGEGLAPVNHLPLLLRCCSGGGGGGDVNLLWAVRRGRRDAPSPLFHVIDVATAAPAAARSRPKPPSAQSYNERAFSPRSPLLFPQVTHPLLMIQVLPPPLPSPSHAIPPSLAVACTEENCMGGAKIPLPLLLSPRLPRSMRGRAVGRRIERKEKEKGGIARTRDSSSPPLPIRVRPTARRGAKRRSGLLRKGRSGGGCGGGGNNVLCLWWCLKLRCCCELLRRWLHLNRAWDNNAIRVMRVAVV